MNEPELSVIIPFYNEEEVAAEVVDETVAALATLGRSYELLLVDDGSVDGTADVLLSAHDRWPACRVFRHESNAGQPAAIWTGFRHSRGEILATLDGDGQNDPADLPEMLRRLGDADMVVGIRAKRRDSRLRRLMSGLANRVRRWWLRDTVGDAGCMVKVFRREVMTSFMPVSTLYFLQTFARRGGFTVIEHVVRHRPRRAGASKYGLRVMLWRPLADMLAIGWLLDRRIPSVIATELRPLPRAESPAEPNRRISDARARR